jgi:hypothetical protein
VVLVTAFGREEVREEAERMQIDVFLLKPVTSTLRKVCCGWPATKSYI